LDTSPYQIPKKEFDAIYDLTEENEDKQLLNKWFKLDKNSGIKEDLSYAVYDLQPITIDQTDNTEKWEAENDLRRILQDGAKKLHKNQDLNKYFTSAVEQEAIDGGVVLKVCLLGISVCHDKRLIITQKIFKIVYFSKLTFNRRLTMGYISY